jgi:hypothetical protein
MQLLLLCEGIYIFDLSLYILGLKIHTAIIWVQKTEFISPTIGRRLAALNTESIKFFLEIEDVGLTPQLELPGVTIGLIKKFS